MRFEALLIQVPDQERRTLRLVEHRTLLSVLDDDMRPAEDAAVAVADVAMHDRVAALPEA
jgi:hypothetical protein